MKNIIEFMQAFGTVEKCLEHLATIRWKNGAYCPHCGSYRKVYHYSDGQRHRCGDCNKVFRLTVGTIFGDSALKMLPKWFAAIWLETGHAKGISSVQLAKDIGVTQKTAWFMLHRIRNAAAKHNIAGGGMLGGDVEIDETYIGGKEKNKHVSKRVEGTQGRSVKTKSVAFGIKEREGKVRIYHLKSATSAAITPVVINNVALGSTVNADDCRAYSTLDTFYDVNRVNHSAGEYVRGAHHTNSIESIWALVKRGHYGTYHYWSRKHLQRYLDEFTFRLNTRELSAKERVDTLLGCGMNARLHRKELIA